MTLLVLLSRLEIPLLNNVYLYINYILKFYICNKTFNSSEFLNPEVIYIL